MRRSQEKRLAARLLRDGKLTESQFRRCMDAQVADGQRRGLIGILLVRTALTADDIRLALADTDPALTPRPAVRPSSRTRVLRASKNLGPGRQLGPYRLLKELGRGGMGAVFLARREGSQRPVALKVLLPELEGDPGMVERFLVEARSLTRMHHENIIRVHQIDKVDGCHFFTMEYVEGSTLGGLLRDRRVRVARPDSPAGRAWLRGAVRVLARVARALHHAHGLGVLHRDLKPENVLLTRDMTPKLIDFGLSKSLADADPGLSQPGSIIGTPDYMSPEQAGGSGRLGPETDVFSLGVILYEVYTGRKPFAEPNVAATLNAILHRDPPRLSTAAPWTPPAVEAICRKALAKDPRARYRSALAMALDLERHLAGRAVLAPSEGTWARLRGILFGR